VAGVQLAADPGTGQRPRAGGDAGAGRSRLAGAGFRPLGWQARPRGSHRCAGPFPCRSGGPPAAWGRTVGRVRRSRRRGPARAVGDSCRSRPAAAGGDPCRRDAHGPALHLRLGPGPDLGAAPGLWNPPAPAGRGGSGRLAVGRGAGAGTAMILRQLILAVQFLTRLPTPQVADFRPDDLTRSARWFPLVGLPVGALVLLPVWLLQDRPLLAGVIGLLAWVWVTGALHLDGLGDVADALGASHRNPQRFLEVLKDPHLGVFGTVAIGMQMLLKMVL